MEGGKPVVMLTYGDTSALNRQILLVLDQRTHELQAVRELVSDGTQTIARDLWRLEQQETLPNLSMTLPQRSRVRLERDHIFDPACLGLDADHVVSLRQLVSSWVDWYLPTRLPPHVEAAAALTPDIVTPQGIMPPQNTRVVYVGADRQLSIGMVETYTNLSGSVQRGRWRVDFDPRPDLLRAHVCAPPAGYVHCPGVPALLVEARGWSEQEILELVDTLTPVNARTWTTLAPHFLEPRPLDPEVQHVLAQTGTAIDIQDGLLQSTVEITPVNAIARPEAQVVSNAPPVLSDPYAVSPALAAPNHLVMQQMVRFSDSKVLRSSQTTTLPNGTLVSAQVHDDRSVTSYDGTLHTQQMYPITDMRRLSVGLRMHVFDRVQSFVHTILPVTVAEQGDAWVLEQTINNPFPYDSDPFRWYRGPEWDALAGTFLERMWIDKETSLPRRLAIFQVDEAGHETMLSALNVTEWNMVGCPCADTFDMPRLPDDTLSYTWDSPSGNPRLRGDLDRFLPPTRALMWRSEYEMIGDANGRRVELSLRSVHPDRFNEYLAANLLNADLDQLGGTGLIRTTRYHVPGNTTQLTVRQGSPALLRHALRNRALNPSSAWTSSRALPVTIAGQEHTAWLLEGASSTMLVVEVDDVLLIFSGTSTDFLTGPLLEALPKLEWVEQQED
jgi:hypothetical protein